MNEWEFTADVASWINEMLAQQPNLPFYRAKCERSRKGSRKRKDLTLLDKDRRAALTGEVKLPYARDGGSPYNSDVVLDARAKAKRVKAPFFFTWNVNEFVLWETTPGRIAWKDQKYKSWHVTVVRNERNLELEVTEHAIRKWLKEFLDTFAQIFRGDSKIGFKAPDEKFIDSLESSLHMPILFNQEELHKRHTNQRFKSELDKWMREEQGWTIYDNPEGIRDNLERASKFACYALVNKIVFHEALLKRHGKEMDKLSVPDYIDTADKLRIHLEGYFSEAKDVTGDYETVFGEEHTSVGNRIPFYSDSAVSHWKDLISQIHKFDFSKLDYEIIGNMLERLLSPEERHKYGQFYTKVEIVDLINSFCINKGDEKVMDPACGGGTFLVRAYIRERELRPDFKHKDLLPNFFGIDISHFATHLTTINLTIRDLVEEDNYPQITRSDFFDIKAHDPFVSLPVHIQAGGLGKIQHREVRIPPLDAVISNPPYVRQEDITKKKKSYYSKLVKEEVKANLSGRSDIHCYFWPHAMSFLKDEGYLCFITSSQWLDVEYGFKLQGWLLLNFEIIAVFESIDEPWFIGARVATTVTILRRQKDEKKRMKNIVRFVQLRKPIREILAHDGTTAGAVNAVNQFRDEILSLQENTINERYRTRLIRQGDLWKKGVRLGGMMGKSKETTSDDPEVQDGDYFGGKWGMFLRAPDLWFKLLDNDEIKLSPIGHIADVRFGVKSGKDNFFFPKDYSEECLKQNQNPIEFEMNYGVPRNQVKSGTVKLVKCGESHGEIRPIESKYLEPEIHSLMEITGFTVDSGECNHLILQVDKKKTQLKNTHVLKYIEWGEENNWHTGATCSARVTKHREWYDLTGHNRAPVLWPKERQYRHFAPANLERFISNCRLYEIYPPQEIGNSNLWGGILNSTWTLLSSLQFGRPVGNEGNWSTMVVDVNMMVVPDLTKTTKGQRDYVSNTFEKMKKRKVLQFLSERRLREMAYKQAGKEHELDALSNLCELDMPDRRELDDAVLEMIGIKSKKRRDELVDELYSYLRKFFELTRQKEEKAIANKKKTKRRGPARPRDIAAHIYQEILEKKRQLLLKYDADFIDKSKPFDTYEIPADGKATLYHDAFISNGVQFIKGKKKILALHESDNAAQAELIVLLAESGIRGFVRVPHEEEECQKVLKQYKQYVKEREKQIIDMIEERTADEEMQKKIYDALIPMLVYRSSKLV